MLWSEDEKHLCKVDGSTKKIGDVGVLNTERFIGEKWGEELDLGRNKFHLLQPAIKDIDDLIDRRAQIILPRIGGIISTYCDLTSGKKVIEAGAGSGALTAVLSQMVRPEGEVVTYEVKEGAIGTAEKNLNKLGLEDVSTIKKGDITQEIEEENADAFILDIPEPWEAVETAENSLKNGGFFCSYIPSVNQLEKITKRLKDGNYIDVKSFENLQRNMVVKKKSVRPSYKMLGHTGYVVIARKK